MTLMLVLIAAWIVLSLPAALLVGAMIRRGQQSIPARRIGLESDEAARVAVATRS